MQLITNHCKSPFLNHYLITSIGVLGYIMSAKKFQCTLMMCFKLDYKISLDIIYALYIYYIMAMEQTLHF